MASQYFKTYTEIADEKIEIITRVDDDGVHVSIPNDPNNRDWIEYQEWLDAGNEPGDDVPPSVDPQAEKRTR